MDLPNEVADEASDLQEQDSTRSSLLGLVVRIGLGAVAAAGGAALISWPVGGVIAMGAAVFTALATLRNSLWVAVETLVRTQSIRKAASNGGLALALGLGGAGFLAVLAFVMVSIETGG